MKLNHDYVRSILLFIEQNLDYENADSPTPSIHKEITDGKLICDSYFDKYDKQELSYALEKLLEAGFITCADKPVVRNGNLYLARITGLTFGGHEFLDNIRNDTVWGAVKELSKKIGGGSIKALASAGGMLMNAMMTDPNAFQNFVEGTKNIFQIIH